MSKIGKFIGISRWVVVRGWAYEQSLLIGTENFYSDENALELDKDNFTTFEYTITTNFTF